MLFPIRTDAPLRSTPYMNWLLIALNCVIFLIQQPTGFLAAWQLRPTDPQLLDFLGYAFLHASPAHLLGNMVFLYIFGNNVNDKMGHLGYLGFYLAGGVVSGIGHVMTATEAVVGASGAVAAVTGAYLALFPRSHITILYWFIIIGMLEISSMWFILLFFAKDLFFQFSASDPMVAHMAHISGTVFGFIVCCMLLATHLLPRNHFDIVALFQRWNRRREYRDVVASGYDPFNYRQQVEQVSRANTAQLEQIQNIRAHIADAVANARLEEAAQLYLQLKAIDPKQVLSRQNQLQIANQLAHDQRYPEAADAYEQFLMKYPNAEQRSQVALMLGLICSRYLQQYDRARSHLTAVVNRMHGTREQELAREELARIGHLSP